MNKKCLSNVPVYNVVCWSGGKDSTATIILAHRYGIKIDLIIMALLWFDKERGIYAENPEHLEWVMNYAKPLFESWGYPVEFVSSERDYMYWFYKIRQSSDMHPDTIGKYYGFVMGGSCKMQGEKVIPIKQRLRALRRQYKVVEYCGICANEKIRLEKMNKRNQISIPEQYGFTTKDTHRLCVEYGLLSPDYAKSSRGGNCWFCPNQKIDELVYLKLNRPDLWEELRMLSFVENTVSRGFSYGHPFSEVEKKVDARIKERGLI